MQLSLKLFSYILKINCWFHREHTHVYFHILNPCLLLYFIYSIQSLSHDNIVCTRGVQQRIEMLCWTTKLNLIWYNTFVFVMRTLWTAEINTYTSGMNALGSVSVIGCHITCCWISWMRSKFFSHIILASRFSSSKTESYANDNMHISVSAASSRNL